MKVTPELKIQAVLAWARDELQEIEDTAPLVRQEIISRLARKGVLQQVVLRLDTHPNGGRKGIECEFCLGPVAGPPEDRRCKACEQPDDSPVPPLPAGVLCGALSMSGAWTCALEPRHEGNHSPYGADGKVPTP